MLKIIVGICLMPFAVLAILATGAMIIGVCKAASSKKDDGCCKNCGQPITEYDQVEFDGDELRQTYHCSCGYWGEQVFDVKYIETIKIN